MTTNDTDTTKRDAKEFYNDTKLPAGAVAAAFLLYLVY